MKLLPSVEFPVPRGTPMISPAVRWDHSVTWAVARDDEANEEGSSFEIDLSENSEYRYFLEHKIDGRPLFPGAGFLVLVWKALANREGIQYDQMPVMFEGVRIHRATILTPDSKSFSNMIGVLSRPDYHARLLPLILQIINISFWSVADCSGEHLGVLIRPQSCPQTQVLNSSSNF